MTNSETVLVTGATGNIGSILVPLLVKSGVRVRALVRDTSKAQALRDSGGEVVQGDLDLPETLPAALSGADRVFFLTWNGPSAQQQGLNMVRAAKEAGIKHFVKQSAYGSPKSRIIQQIDAVDAALVASGLDYTLLKPTFFFQNVMMAAQTVASDGMVYMPFGDGKAGMIDVRDIADSAHAVLTSNGHIGKSYVLTGPESISFHNIAAELSSILGKQITYVNVPLEAGTQAMIGMGVPEWIAEGYAELNADFAQDWANTTTGNVELLTGHKPRAFRQFATDFAAVFGGVEVGATN